MPNTHATDQPRDGIRIEYIADHPVRLALVKATFWTTGDNTASILASMLEQRKTFAYLSRCIREGIV